MTLITFVIGRLFGCPLFDEFFVAPDAIHVIGKEKFFSVAVAFKRVMALGTLVGYVAFFPKILSVLIIMMTLRASDLVVFGMSKV